MKVKVSKLSGIALDWAVAKCEGLQDNRLYLNDEYGFSYLGSRYSVSWSQGGPIIEREGILFALLDGNKLGATINKDNSLFMQRAKRNEYLIAAMRCYVASKLGDEVEVPDELLK